MVEQTQNIPKWTNPKRHIEMILMQQNILEQLKLGPATRDDLIEALCIPRTTIYDNINRLMKQKLVEFEDKGNGKRGRPLRYFRLTISKEVRG